MIFDDLIVHKPHTDESELGSWHFDHTENRSVKGINVLTAFYHSHLPGQEMPLRIPVLYEAVKKEIHFCELKNTTGKTSKQHH